MLELAELVWNKINGRNGRQFKWVSDPPYPYDVQTRVPDTSKAKAMLGFEAATSLDEMLDEVIPWIQTQIAEGTI